MPMILDIEHRVAILRRYRDTLLAQRDRLENYLHLLDEEERVIRGGDIDRLQYHVEAEQALMRELAGFDRVLAPLDIMYHDAYPNRESEIPPLVDALERLRREVLARNERNRRLLRQRMEELRRSIRALHSRTTARPVFAGAVLVDVSA